MPPFSTARLTVRDWQDVAQDPMAEAALATALPVILTEPVLRHLPPDLQHTGSGFDQQTWVATLRSRNDVGVVMTADTSPIGFVVLREERPSGQPPHIWIGYLLAEHAWGQGYATELVRGLIGALRDAGGLQVRAGVAAENAGSMRVLEKVGFVVDRDRSGDDWTVFILPDT